MVSSLENHYLRNNSAPGKYYVALNGNVVRCYACGHNCVIQDGKSGICRVRYNQGGVLYVPMGYTAGLGCDPIEKKPFYHVYPGSIALSFGMLGCNYHCDFCQNWESSQVLRDEDAGVSIESVTPEQIIELAHRYHAKVLTSTYNEPLITSEWAVSIFEMGKAAGFKGSYVSNGHATPEILDALRPYVDFFKVDLKCFDAKHYRGLGGNLDTVLNTIRLLKEKGYWVEIVTLIIPEFNDSEDELHRMAQFIASVSVDIPWHVTAFHPDYHRDAAGYTLVNTLIRACEMGTAEGLRFCYAGNLPGEAGEWENTRCFSCKKTLVTRRGFRVQENLITGNQCPFCQTVIPGYWN